MTVSQESSEAMVTQPCVSSSDGNICAEAASGGPFPQLVIEETYSIMKQQDSLLTPSFHPFLPLHTVDRSLAQGETRCILRGGCIAMVMQYLFPHSRACTRTGLSERKREHVI